MNTPDAPNSDLDFGRTAGWFQKFAAWVATYIARGGFSLEVCGTEHLAAKESFIISANHASHLDTFVLVVAADKARERLVFLGARDYFFSWRWRRFLVQSLICLVPFERARNLAATQENLRRLEACKAAGRIIALYPEGTRSRNGEIGEFKSSIAFFAEKLGLRVVPCRLEGTFEALPKGRVLPRFHPLRVTFGAPCAVPPGPSDETGPARKRRYTEFATDLKNQIDALPGAARVATSIAGQ